MQMLQHPQEQFRLASLHALEIIGTPRDSRFDRLVFLASRIAGTPIAQLNFIGAERQWTKAYVGMSGSDIRRELTFCSMTILQRAMFVVSDAREDPRFSHNPFVCGAPFVRFYAGVPLHSFDGLALGSLCVIDTQPRRLTENQILALNALGKEAEQLLDDMRNFAVPVDAGSVTLKRSA